jgi:hypothetical protein
MTPAQVKEFMSQANCEADLSRKAQGKPLRSIKPKTKENSNLCGELNSNGARVDLN